MTIAEYLSFNFFYSAVRRSCIPIHTRILSENKVKSLLKQMCAVIPRSMYSRLHQIMSFAHVFAPKTASAKVCIQWIGKITRLFIRTRAITVEKARTVYALSGSRLIANGVARFRVYKKSLLIANPLWMEWEMVTEEYTNMAQWLPAEMVEDIGTLLGRIHGPYSLFPNN